MLCQYSIFQYFDHLLSARRVLSDNAILALNGGAKLGGFYHNTGEGGISKFHKEPGGDICWNVGTGYFGCGSGSDKREFDADMFKENAALPQVKMYIFIIMVYMIFHY